MHWEARFRTLAAEQHGVVGIDQTGAIGCDCDHWWRARRNGRWEPLSDRVLLLAGTPPSEERRALAAVLDAGGDAVLHGRSTLAWCGLRGFDLSTIEVVRRRGTTNSPAMLAEVHRVRDLRDADVTTLRGVPTVTPLRAIWSEASRYGAEHWFERGLVRVGRILDDAHRARLVTWDALHRSVDDLGCRGRSGTRVMRELARTRVPGTSPTESRLEERFEEVLAGAGASPLCRQVVVGGDRPIGRADHRDPDLPMVAEVNSLLFHSTPSDQHADEARYTAMVEAGFAVVVVWEGDLWSVTSSVIRAVAEGRRRARAGRPAVIHTAGCPWPSDPDRIVVRGYEPPTRG